MTEWNRIAKALERIADALDRATPIPEQPWRLNNGDMPTHNGNVDLTMMNPRSKTVYNTNPAEWDWSNNTENAIAMWRPAK